MVSHHLTFYQWSGSLYTTFCLNVKFKQNSDCKTCSWSKWLSCFFGIFFWLLLLSLLHFIPSPTCRAENLIQRFKTLKKFTARVLTSAYQLFIYVSLLQAWFTQTSLVLLGMHLFRNSFAFLFLKKIILWKF